MEERSFRWGLFKWSTLWRELYSQINDSGGQIFDSQSWLSWLHWQVRREVLKRWLNLAIIFQFEFFLSSRPVEVRRQYIVQRLGKTVAIDAWWADPMGFTVSFHIIRGVRVQSACPGCFDGQRRGQHLLRPGQIQAPGVTCLAFIWRL